MRKISTTIRKILIGFGLIFFLIPGLTLAAIPQNETAGAANYNPGAVPPSTPTTAAPSPDNTNTGKVTQPPIIPSGATSNQKLYLPHDLSQDTNANYVQNRLLPGITTMIIGLTGGLSLLFVILSGIQLLTSYADSAAMDKAKKTLTYAIAGIIISGLSYAIVAIVSSINVR
jgi:hypothetical protein